MTLTLKLKEKAHELGFARMGVARAEPLGEEAFRLKQWLADEHHGSMQWMKRTESVRCDPTDERMVLGAKSVLVLVAPYRRAGPMTGPHPGRVARYALGRDYHNVLTKRARKIAKILIAKNHHARVSVDSMPVYERAWAERSGVGFIGKNCCLIVPGLGSHVFLTCIVTTAELNPDAPLRRGCGSCRACLDACPTDAFPQPRILDARRCVSYLTIEHRDSIPTDLRSGIGNHIFGCDDCQDVCPYNRTSMPPTDTTEPFAPSPRWKNVDASQLLSMTEKEFLVYAQGSPLRRTGLGSMARNAALVLGNSGDRRYLQVLQEAAAKHEVPIVRETAEWSVGKLLESE